MMQLGNFLCYINSNLNFSCEGVKIIENVRYRPMDCWIVFDCNRKIARVIERKEVDTLLKQYRRVYDFVRVVVFRKEKYILFGNGKFRSSFKNESIFTMVNDFTNGVVNFCNKTSTLLYNVGTDAGKMWIVDFLSFLMDLTNFLTMKTLITMITRLTSLIIRLGSLSKFRSEVISGMDLITFLVTWGAPVTLQSYAKELLKFSSQKILDSRNLFLDFIINVLNILLEILKWLSAKHPLVKSIYDWMNDKFSFVRLFRYEKELKSIVMKYSKNPQTVLDPIYRTQVTLMDTELNADSMKIEFLSDNRYTYIKQYYESFLKIVKLVKNYDRVSRPEPVCFVLEGPAGCGKSTVMNYLLDFMRSQNFSTYTHSCPPVDAGKDFWDDYSDQDILVMDDVGQQGVSQWRQIINLVSPVKYPLECASVELKNTKYFSSKGIVVTTNRFSNLTNFTKTDCISEPSALFRRAHVIQFSRNPNFNYDVKYKKYDFINDQWKDEFLEGSKLDNNVVPKGIQTNEKRDVAVYIYSLFTHFLKITQDHNTVNQIDIREKEAFLNSVNQFKTTYRTENWLMSMRGWCADKFNLVVDRITEFSQSITFPSFEGGDYLEVVKAFVIPLSIALISRIILRWFKGRTNDSFKQREYQIEMYKKFMESNHVKELKQFKRESKSDGCEILKDRMRYVKVMYDVGGEELEQEFQCVVSGNRMLIPYHAYEENMKINIYKDWTAFVNNVMEVNMAKIKLIKAFKHLDLAVIELPHTYPIYKNMSEFLFRPLTKVSDIFYVNCGGVKDLTSIVVPNENFSVSGKEEIHFPEGAGLFYNISCQGLCGSILFSSSVGFLGVHIAGDGERGFSIVPSVKEREELKGLLDSRSCEYEIVEFSKNPELCNVSGIRFFHDDLEGRNVLSKTSLVPTPLYGEFQDIPRKERGPPNFLSHGGKTMQEMSKKSFKPVPKLNRKAIEFGKKCLNEFLDDFDEISWTEVVSGGDGLSRLNKDSVNGYGYDKEKEKYIDFENGELTPEMNAIIDNFVNKCNSDTLEIKDLLSYEAFKDELRIKEKIDKPRVFRIMPLHHTLLLKKLLGNVFKKIKSEMWFNQIALGLNPYQDWNKLYVKMKKNSTVFDGDVGNWDGGCNPEIQDGVNELVESRYKGSNPKVLHALLESIVRTPVLSKTSLFGTTHSMPSGCWVTALFNSFYNRMITAITLYEEMALDGKEATVEDFLNLTDFVMGDDKICGAPKSLEKYFNALTVKKTFNKMGMEYTNGDKTPIVNPGKDLKDCVFLKRYFRFHPKLNKVVGALSFNTIVSMLEWVDCKKDFDVVMSGRFTVIRYELFLHNISEEIELYDDETRQSYIMNVNSFLERIKRLYERNNLDYPEISEAQIMRTMIEDRDLYLKMMTLLGKNYMS